MEDGRPRPGRPADAEQVRLAELKPPDDPPQTSAAADEIIARIGRAYSFGPMTHRPAAEAVTGSVRSGTGTTTDRGLARPTFLAAGQPPTAVDRGSATHAVLQHVDFAGGGDAAAQVANLVADGRLSTAEAAAADVAAVDWFLSSDVGRQLHAHAKQVRREVPVTFAAGDGPDPMDRTMVRGRIDLLVPTAAGGWLVVDFKTGRVGVDDIDAKAAEYAGQLGHYRDAVRRITGSADVSAVVVFLSARVAVPV